MAVERTQGRTFDLERLLNGVHSGKVVLPEFQRDFKWSPGDISALLATALAGWPLGSLLVVPMSPSPQFATRSFEGTPPATSHPEWIVLDGQQRLTSLYQALYGRGDNIYSIRLDLNPDDPIEGLEQAIDVTRREKWLRRYPSPESQFQDKRVPVYVLREAADFFEWRDAATDSPAEREQLSQLYRHTLSGLQSYTVPSVVIDESLPTQAIARVFERVNRQGLPLSTFDLMVAVTYREKEDFNLKVAWGEVQEEFPRMAAFVEGDGLPLLTLLALRYANDIRQKAVLELPRGTVGREFRAAAEAINDSADYMQTHFGAVKLSALPFPAMLQVVAGLAWDRRLDAMSLHLARWYWSTSFGLKYAVAANTRAVADFRSLERGELDVGDGIAVSREDVLMSTKRKNSALHKALMNAAAIGGLADLHSGEPIDYDEVDVASFVESSLAPRASQAHTRSLAHVWADPSVQRMVEANPGSCHPKGLESQRARVLLDDVELDWEARLARRAEGLLSNVEAATQMRVELVDELADGDHVRFSDRRRVT
ncbi:DUF262 domain-containing protein [Nocardioides sp.]|jgi:hypothetical protein